MQIKDTEDDPSAVTMPKTAEESELVQMMFEKATDLFPDWKMGDRTDLAMSMLAVVKRWAHKNEASNYAPVENDVVEEVDQLVYGTTTTEMFPLPPHVAKTTID